VIEGVSDTNTPYDTLFRTAFEKPETAQELTLLLLPQTHAGRLAGARVTVEPELLVDDQARKHRTDLLLQFTWPRRTARDSSSSSTAYVYVLYEHKSYRYRWVTAQLLHYMATIWQRLSTEREQHQDDVLPEILPVVLYHGEERWDAPLQFAELIARGPDSTHTPNYRPVFVDLTTIPDDQITGSLRAVLGLVAMKYSRLQLKQDAVDRLTELLHRGEADPAVRHLARVVQRIYANVKSSDDVERLVAAASRLGYHEIEGGYMTFAQEMVEKGRNEGLETGSLQRSREVLVRQLDRKFGLTEAERDRILSCGDSDALDAALDEIITADAKASVLSKLS
jgi:predicted transposase/invertase (TIGR01784 family)